MYIRGLRVGGNLISTDRQKKKNYIMIMIRVIYTLHEKLLTGYHSTLHATGSREENTYRRMLYDAANFALDLINCRGQAI